MAVEVAKESGQGSPQNGKEISADTGAGKAPRAFTQRGRTLIEAIVAEHGSYSHATSIAWMLGDTGKTPN